MAHCFAKMRIAGRSSEAGAALGSAPRDLPALREAPGGVRTNAKGLDDRDGLGRRVALPEAPAYASAGLVQIGLKSGMVS